MDREGVKRRRLERGGLDFICLRIPVSAKPGYTLSVRQNQAVAPG
jgi:hypothetical protein